MRSSTLPHRFWSKVNVTDGCWLWTAAKANGYGQFLLNRKLNYAHRLAYIDAKGPIQEGLVLDHLCRTPACVNPDHLEPVTVRQNNLRGISPVAKAAQQISCIHGHPLNGENLYVRPDGHRACKQCKVETNRRWRARVAGAAA